MRPKRLVGVLNLAAVWVGRDELLDRLYAQLMSSVGPKVMALVGQGGIGKTSLVAKLVERCGVDFGREEIAVDCPFDGVFCLRVGEGMGFDEVAGKLMGALGLPDRDFVKPADKLEAIWRGLRREKWLVVLDNLEDVLHPVGHERSGRAIDPDLGKLLNGLVYEVHSARVVLTSREKLRDLADSRSFSGEADPGLVVVEAVEGLATEAGMELLREFGLRDGEADLRWVVERVGGHVFVLRQLASLAVGKPGFLRKNPLLVTREAGPILRVQLGRLDAEALELLKRMCVLRVGIDVGGLTFLRLYDDQTNSVMVADDLQVAETQALIDQLINCSLIQNRYDERTCEDFYDLHRLVVEFLQAEFEMDLRDFLQRAYAFYRMGKTVENPKTLEDLRPLLEAQHFAFQLGSYDETESLIYKLEDYLESWGHWTLLQGFYQQILDRISDSSRPYILQRLGLRERYWGNWDAAEQYYQAGLKLAEKYQDQSLIAALAGNLGDIESKRGNWDSAEQLYRQKLEMCEKLGDRQGLSQVISTMGNIERDRGNWDAAERLYQQSLQHWTELGNRSRMASSWGQLGNIESKRGNWDAAEQLYQRYLQVSEELGDRAGIANSWGALGDIERNRGNWDVAERLYRQSLQMCEELGDKTSMAALVGCLGENELGRSNLGAAEAYLKDALVQMQQFSMTKSIAETNWDLAQLETKRHNPTAAQTHYTTAHNLYTQLGAAKDLEKIEQEWREIAGS